jgi:hypothetical protein
VAEPLTPEQFRHAWLIFRKTVSTQIRAYWMSGDGAVSRPASDLATAFATSETPSVLNFPDGSKSTVTK